VCLFFSLFQKLPKGSRKAERRLLQLRAVMDRGKLPKGSRKSAMLGDASICEDAIRNSQKGVESSTYFVWYLYPCNSTETPKRE